MDDDGIETICRTPDRFRYVYPSCGLCRFLFQVGETVMIFRGNCDPLTVRHGLTAPYKLTACPTKMTESDHGYHPSCVDLVSPDLMASPYLDQIWQATLPEPVWAIPSLSTVMSRLPWLEETFAQNLFLTIRNRLPLEICRYIARHCRREQATQSLRDLWMRNMAYWGCSEPGDVEVSVGRNATLRIQFMQFEDRQYVRCVGDARWSDEGMELFTFKPTKRVNIFIASDPLGVRQPIIMPEGEIPNIKPQRGVGWNIYRRIKPPFLLKGYGDCLKVRHLAVVNSREEYPKYDKKISRFSLKRERREFHEVEWPLIPMPLESFPAPSIPYQPRRSGEAEALQAIDWNSPGIYGYSFAVLEDVILEIIPHRVEDKVNHDVLGYGDPQKCWIYMPMDPNERISELWTRSYVVHDHSDRFRSLIVCTSQGRRLALGRNMREAGQDIPEIRYKAIVKLPEAGPSRMFLTNDSCSIAWLGFEQVSTWNSREVMLPTSQLSMAHPSIGDYYYSSATLEDVVEVAICHSWKKYSRPLAIMGLLFTYSDGHQRSTGEVRLDYLEEPIKVSAHSMWIKCTKRQEDELYDWRRYDDKYGVEWVGFDKPPNVDDETHCLVEVPWRGRLDWCFTDSQCHVSHHDNTKFRDEMEEVLGRDKTEARPVESLSEVVGNMFRFWP